MKFLALSATSATAEGISGIKEAGEKIWKAGKAISVSSMSNVTITTGKLHKLIFNKKAFASQFQLALSTPTTLKATGSSSFVVLTEHNPEEFAGPVHFLLTSAGTEVKAEATTDVVVQPEPKTSVGEAVGAAFCVAVASFIGVILLVPGFAWLAGHFNILGAIDAFASGAILALIVFIIIPESLPSIATEYPIESQTSAWFGTLMLLGFITPILIDWLVAILFPDAGGHGHGHGAIGAKKSDTQTSDESRDHSGPYPMAGELEGAFNPEAPPQYFYPTPVPSPHVDVEQSDPSEEDTVKQAPTRKSKIPRMVRDFFKCCPFTAVTWSITIGDGLHNFCDGVLLGVAFKFCGSATGWAIVGASVIHELASELSEFWLLINPEAGKLSWLQAVALNFFTSLTVVWGCLMIYFLNITSFTLGLLLAFCGGLLLYIATVSIWSRLGAFEVTLPFIGLMFVSFAFGATCIGLVLFSHQHCDASASGSHAGHAH